MGVAAENERREILKTDLDRADFHSPFYNNF